MRRRFLVALSLFVLLGVASWTPAEAQTVKHIQTRESGIATAVWVGDMLYVSGQLPTPVTPADRAKGTPAVYGNTQAQAPRTPS